MGSRGRGRGGGRRMLDSMGIPKNELSAIQKIGDSLHEPFPALQYKPLPMPLPPREEEKDQKVEPELYMLEVKKETTTIFQNSKYFIVAETKTQDTENYSGQYHIPNKKKKLDYNWDWYPQELKPVIVNKKRKSKTTKPILKNKKSKLSTLKTENFEDKFRELEEKEVTIKEEDDPQNRIREEEEDENEKDSEAEDNEAMDDEEEEGDDYTEAYFENGDDYGADEDDALEEGAHY